MFPLTRVKNDIEIDGFHAIYYFEFDKNYYHLPESHNFWEIVYVDKGEIITLTDGKSSTLSEGQAIFHKP